MSAPREMMLSTIASGGSGTPVSWGESGRKVGEKREGRGEENTNVHPLIFC